MLIVSGSTRSFIDPNIAQKCFPNLIINDPFVVSTVFQKSAHKHSVSIPASKIFNLQNPMNLKFYLFKFHNIFEGLIGLDNLKLLKAEINLSKGILVTPHTKIRLKFHQPSNDLNLIPVGPRTEQVVKIKTTVSDGEIIIPYQKIHSCGIPECLTISKDHFAITTILNNTTDPIILIFSQPIFAEPFDLSEMQEIDLSYLETSKKPNLDLSKIRVDHLTTEEKSMILELCREFSDVFYDENTPLTFTNRIKHQIRTVDERPVYSKSYRYPFVHREEVRSQIQKMLDSNIIRPSNSAYLSPIWVIPKKLDASGKQKWGVVIDYRRLNEKTIDDKYPLPNINDLLDKLGRCQYFTTLDLASGFHQIEMDEADIEKTGFSTENGCWEFLRMPFGLKNAPATFQRVMDNILWGIQNEKCLTYLDDTIIFSSSLTEHIQNLRAIFQRLRSSYLKIQLDKS
nr:unnamed protein product [Callosobruchus chinensis]